MRGAKGERLVEEKGGPGGRPGDGVGKIAPGMEVAFKVVFAPSDKGDYAVNLVVATEREVHRAGAMRGQQTRAGLSRFRAFRPDAREAVGARRQDGA